MSAQSALLLQQQSLPIYQYKDQLIQTILENQFCVITGETGSGKSTQLPQYLLDSEKIKNKLLQKKNQFMNLFEQQDEQNQLRIVITQPRRMAAISMAKRISYERNDQLGKQVGYTIRFDDKSDQETQIKYVTDGILVRECLSDPNLIKYNIVILDEAHERSLYTDILFTLVKKAVKSRNGSLQLIVTSATLNVQQFSQFFDNCPVIQMEGKCYPVDIKYGNCLSNKRVEESVKSAIRMHLHEGTGDILVFLTGSEECEQAAKLCLIKLEELIQRGQQVPGMVIYSLYGSQAIDEQSRVFEKLDQNTRKLIFSTNIAETSITIDNIGFVIDSGFVKQKCYNSRTGMDALIAVPISKVQAIQRAGRAGRTQPGKCYRMYTESFFKNQMIEYTVPEILRVNLCNVMLTLKTMSINDVLNFDYIESPEKLAILNGLKQLFLLQAIDENGYITDLGKVLAKYPLEPSYSKSLISSIFMQCEDMMINLVSLLSTENIFTKVSYTNKELYTKFEKVQSQFIDTNGDHLTLLRIYNQWVKSGFSSQFCKDHFLNIRAFRQTENIRIQIKEICKKINTEKLKQYYQEDPIYKIYQQNKSSKLDKMNNFKMALTTGFFFNTARQMINSNESYIVMPEGNVVNVDQQSIYYIKDRYPPYVVFTELSGSSVARGQMRQITEIQLEWVEGYQALIKNVNLKKLGNIQEQEQEIITILKQRIQTDKNDKNESERQNKIQESRERYLLRKKIKL